MGKDKRNIRTVEDGDILCNIIRVFMPPFPTARILAGIFPTSRDVGYKYGVGFADWEPRFWHKDMSVRRERRNCTANKVASRLSASRRKLVVFVFTKPQ